MRTIKDIYWQHWLVRRSKEASSRREEFALVWKSRIEPWVRDLHFTEDPNKLQILCWEAFKAGKGLP
jgi:hypothetical protein